VLERNVSTQLRKIAFSALVYGGLVIVCLGAVVWGIGRVTGNIFPIRWTSSAPVLESPVDLLVYNFVMPFAITFTEPATVLHAVYKWWFRKCARWLRLTHFLFGERIEDEMYIFVRDPFKHIRIKDATLPAEYLNEERRLLQSREIASYYLNGYFVRAPASDQVRLPKGTKTFVAVDELGNRTDGLPDSDQGLHGRNNRLFKKIFIPYRFGVRITTFLALLWIFAGVTGMGCTMLPLLFGRWLFGQFCPPEFQVNDIYAFAVGAYVLGVPLYLAIRFYPNLRSAAMRLLEHPLISYLSMSTIRPALQHATAVVMRALRLAYFYGTLGLILPALTGLLWEMYVVIPLLTLSHTNPAPPYTIRFVQAWTLAVVALKFATKVLLDRPESAPARAFRALVSPANRGAGWADPDVRLATRAIVVPALVVLALALAIPPTLAAGVLRFAAPDDATLRPLVFRYAYPSVLGVGLSVLAGRGLGKGLRAWRERVRDEVFLVGERLHNFGERTAGSSNVGRPRAERRGSQRVEME
jgi:E3 ubiquitin-protein ligase MARCH6